MLRVLIEAMRPRQWVKNLIVFAGLLFSKRFLHAGDLVTACAAFAVFCLLSGVVYLVNDIADAAEDRQHALKRLRPVASGRLPRGLAAVFAALIAALSLIAARGIGPGFAATALGYLVLMLAYSLFLKHVVIVDVLAIAVEISPWLLICTILLALFLALSKRRHEIVLLEGNAPLHRPILEEYSTGLLDQMIAVVTSSTLMAYVLYSLSPRTHREVSARLYLTIPFVLYGIFRYLWLVHQKEEGGSPETTLLSDRPLLADIVLWAAAVGALLWME